MADNRTIDGTDSAGKTWSEMILGWCSRPNVRDGLIKEIDGLRLVAIVGTIFTHLATTISKKAPSAAQDAFTDSIVFGIAEAGYVGVSLFFAISGFILAVPFARAAILKQQPPTLKNFYLRRVSRIEPPYIINLLLFSTLIVLIGRRSFSDIVPRFFASCFYLHNVFYDPKDMINIVGWSLEVEAQFYALVPLFAGVFWIANKTVRRSVILSVITGLSAWTEMSSIGRSQGFSLLSQLMFFAVGFLMADIHVSDWGEKKPRQSAVFDLIGYASAMLMFVIVWQRGLDRLLVSGCIFAFMLSAFRGKSLSRVLSHSWIYTMGGMCYSTYLYHYAALVPICAIAFRLLPTPSNPYLLFVMMACIALPPIFAITVATFKYLERPFATRGWASSLWGSLQSRFTGDANQDNTPERGLGLQPALATNETPTAVEHASRAA